MRIAAAILGCSGPRLTAGEAAFFREARPWGFILFGRNIETPDQVRALCDDLRETVGRADAPILVDQEGGRVQRLGPPHWRRYPAARAYGTAGDVALARLGGRLIAQDLRPLGITVDCLPVLDVPADGASDVVGDRAYGVEPSDVARYGRAAAEGLMAGGVLPVMKHMPGHGRARADSHHELPVVGAPWDVLSVTDFAPFRDLADLPMAMTAHVVFADIDAEQPATTSSAVFERVIRGTIGFEGLVMSDDLTMKALAAGFMDKAQAARRAGCDVVLHGGGDLAEMADVIAGAGELDGRSAERAEAALARLQAPQPFDVVASEARFEAVFGGRAAA